MGTLARYLLANFVHRAAGDQFPYGTLVVNLIGCFLIGFLADLAEEKLMLGLNTRLLLVVGFCGAFTTFSTFILETSHLIKEGHSWLAFSYVLLAVTAGFGLFRLGVYLAQKA